jgi:hypothetical protein
VALGADSFVIDGEAVCCDGAGIAVFERRLLELLVASDDGITEALLLAHGFGLEVIVGVVRAGLAAAQAEPILAGGRAVDVSRVRITESGRRALLGL